ncbi:MAG: hypothetical protein HZB59_11430 [Ignavibacteriales bacterium]|nr:hypothetical protein [Ignavibacteriales bacterium]
MKYIYLISILVVLVLQISNGQSIFLKNYSLNEIEATTFPPSNSVSHTVVNNSAIYIGTGNGLAKSLDGGRSWLSFKTDPAFAYSGIFAISTYGDTIWAAMGYEKDVNGNGVQTGGGYAASFDAGNTWQHFEQVIDQNGDSIISYCPPGYPCINDSIRILPVIVPEQNVTFDISITSGSIWIASWASSLRKSTDNGQTWQRILLPLDNMNIISPTDTLYSFAPNDPERKKRIFIKYDPRLNNNLLAFSVYAVSPDTIWCGTADGVNRSTDGGISWTKMNHQNQALPILGNWVISIKEQRFSGIKRLWTTNWRAQDNREEFGVSYSDDFGETWTNRLHGIRAYGFAFKDSIAYIATEDGIYRTNDGGENFIRISDLADHLSHQYIYSAKVYSVDVIGDSVYVGTNEGFARTIDNSENPFGKSWTIYRTFASVGNSSETYAYPNPFAPSTALPAADAYVRIHYGKKSGDPNSTGSRSVTIEIFDFGMNRVRTLLNNATRPDNLELDELWDGRDDKGTVVANGVYFYLVKIDDNESTYGKILVLQ